MMHHGNPDPLIAATQLRQRSQHIGGHETAGIGAHTQGSGAVRQQSHQLVAGELHAGEKDHAEIDVPAHCIPHERDQQQKI
jgi:hypothetical protein